MKGYRVATASPPERVLIEPADEDRLRRFALRLVWWAAVSLLRPPASPLATPDLAEQEVIRRARGLGTSRLAVGPEGFGPSACLVLYGELERLAALDNIPPDEARRNGPWRDAILAAAGERLRLAMLPAVARRALVGVRRDNPYGPYDLAPLPLDNR